MLPQTEFIRHGKSNALFTFIALLLERVFSVPPFVCCAYNSYMARQKSTVHHRCVFPCCAVVRPVYEFIKIKRVLSSADTRSVKNRTHFGYSACSFALSVLVIYLIPTKVPIRISIPIINGTTGFLTKPAMM